MSNWLQQRLWPRDNHLLMIAAYMMILVALVVFVLYQRDLDPPRFYGGLVGLAAMFVLHMRLLELETQLGEIQALRVHLVLNGSIWLLVSWAVTASANFSFVPYLLFMLVAQAVVTLDVREAILATALLLGGWAGILALVGFGPLLIVANLISIGAGLIFVVIFSTVTRLYAAQTARAEALLEQLRAANLELEQARRRERELAAAEERIRLARDIHDGLGHHLTALHVQLQAASRLFERDPARAATALATSREIAQAALSEVRQSVAAMRQSPLDGHSLPEALSTLADEFGRRAELISSLEVTGTVYDLSPAVAQTLYRAAQEGLTNARRHGAAQRAWLHLHYAPARVELVVRDDGHGSANPTATGFGLAGLRERAEQLGGTMAAAPEPGGGFGLRISLPN
ncbi:MAG: sensor histidine kinase [Oscillochloridaceae bacterium umkhey_bin13]